MIVSGVLKSEITSINQIIKSKATEAVHCKINGDDAQIRLTALISSMNVREKYLNGWFGGNRNKVSDREKNQSQISELVSRVDDLKSEIKSLDLLAKKIIDEYLRIKDPDYQILVEPYDAALKVQKATAFFIRKVDRALSEVRDAQGMETLDILSKNSAISILSYMENSEASEAIKRVQVGVVSFQEAINSYNNFIKGYKAPKVEVEICDGIDLFFDLVFDGFDFMSIFTLFFIRSS